MVALRFALSIEAAAKLSDILICLAKFSETVFLEAKRDQLSLSTLNSSKSAYVAFNLEKSFFLNYSYHPTQGSTQGRFTCAIANRAFSSVFRPRVFDVKAGKDTGITRCEVQLQESDDVTACRLLIRLICTYGVTKTYKLTYESVEVMHALFNKDHATNTWSIKSHVLREFADHFAPKAEQLDLYCEDEKITFMSFTEKVVNSKSEILKHPMKTSIALDLALFDNFDAQEQIHTIISVKDFRAVVAHAVTLLNSTIAAYYSVPGRPLQFAYNHDGMSCQFTLMTAGNAGANSEPASRMQSRAPSRQSTRAPSVANSRAGNSSNGVQVARTADPSFVSAVEVPRTANPSFVVNGSAFMDGNVDGEMPPPAMPASQAQVRRAAGRLGQSHQVQVPSSAIQEEDEDEESLFVGQNQDADADDQQWDPANLEEEEIGWNINADADAAPFGTMRDSFVTSSRMPSMYMDGSTDEAPPTQRISQVRGLW